MERQVRRKDHLAMVVNRARANFRLAKIHEVRAAQATTPAEEAEHRVRARKAGEETIDAVYRLEGLAERLDGRAEGHKRGNLKRYVRTRVACRRRAAQLRAGARMILGESRIEISQLES